MHLTPTQIELLRNMADGSVCVQDYNSTTAPYRVNEYRQRIQDNYFFLLEINGLIIETKAERDYAEYTITPAGLEALKGL